jgi:chaperonin GroES
MAKKETKTAKVLPLGDRVLIRPVDADATKSPSGIIIPDSAQKKESKEGKVIAVGPGRLEEGKRIEIALEIGDKVLYRQGWDNEIEIDEVKHYLVNESDILAIIE